MADISLYTALIAGAAGVGGAAIPAITGLVRDVSVAKRDRGERKEAERSQACLDLLQSAKQLQTIVANAAHYHGPEMGARLEEIRACEAEILVHAAKVALRTTAGISDLAARLAEAAGHLTALVEQNMRMDSIEPKPDMKPFSESIERFREAIVNDAGVRN